MPLEFPIDATHDDVEPDKGTGTEYTEPSYTDSFGSMTDDEVKNFFNQAFTDADEKRKQRELIWQESWDLYSGHNDWSGKADWQSKSNIPKVRTAVDRTASSFRQALIRLNQFYQAEAESKLGYEKGNFSIMLLDYWIKNSDFFEEFTTAVKSGLITSMAILKVYWGWVPETKFEVDTSTSRVPKREYGIQVGSRSQSKINLKETEEIVGKFQVKAVDPFRFWVIPRLNGHAVIEHVEMQMCDLEELADRGIYLKSAVKKLKDGRISEAEAKAEEARRTGESIDKASVYFRPVDVYHYWGDLFDDEGNCKARNCTFTIASKDVVLRRPRKNPFFHGKLPYVWGSPFIVPFSTYHRGLVEDVIGLANMITELGNLVVDGAQFEAAKGFEVDIDMVNDRNDLRDGIYPGVVLPKKGLQSGPVDKPMIRPIETGKVPTESIGVLSMLTNEFNEAVGVPNVQPQNKKSGDRNSAAEMQMRAGLATNGEDATRTLEETLINPFLNLAIKTIYQFHDDYVMTRLTENFPQTTSMLRDMSQEERYVVMAGDHSFKARGISIMLDKQQMLGKVAEFMQLAGSIPGMLQRINLDSFLEEVFNLFGWNPNKMLVQQTPPVTSPGEPNGGGPPTPFPNPVTPNAQNPMQAQAGLDGVIYGGATNNPMAATNNAPQR